MTHGRLRRHDEVPPHRQATTSTGFERIASHPLRPLQITFGPSNSMLERCPTTPEVYPEKSGFAPRRERECGHRRHCAGANRRPHPCGSISLVMTESPLCRDPPAAVNEGEVVVASNEELH